MRKSVLWGLGAAMLVSQSVQAEGWQFLAGKEPGYKAEPIISLMAGQMSPDDSDLDSGTIIGAELSLNCVLLQPPTNRLRQQISVTRYDETIDGVDLTITNIELNPHYVVEVAPNVEVGGGPGLGFVMTSADFDGSKDPNYFAFQLGASVHYTGLPVFLGAEWRYQMTTDEEFVSGGTKDDINNSRFAVKVGYAF